MPALVERQRARIFTPELGAVDRYARPTGLDIGVAAHADIHFVSRWRGRLGENHQPAVLLPGTVDRPPQFLQSPERPRIGSARAAEDLPRSHVDGIAPDGVAVSK